MAVSVRYTRRSTAVLGLRQIFTPFPWRNVKRRWRSSVQCIARLPCHRKKSVWRRLKIQYTHVLTRSYPNCCRVAKSARLWARQPTLSGDYITIDLGCVIQVLCVRNCSCRVNLRVKKVVLSPPDGRVLIDDSDDASELTVICQGKFTHRITEVTKIVSK